MNRVVVFLLLLPSAALGQEYVAEAPLPAVSQPGFYSVPLDPAITSRLTTDYRNVRILDEKDVQVPYILEQERPEFSRVEFVSYKFDKEQVKNHSTTLTLYNERENTISNVVLEVKNAQVTKIATLQGSDDRRTWYALKERFTLGEYHNNNTTTDLEILHFPLSNYKFYQIQIDDSTSAPLNVVKVGYYNTSTDLGGYVEVPGVSVAPLDTATGKSTWAVIKLSQKGEFIDKLFFDIEGPRFYQRPATLYRKEVYPVRRSNGATVSTTTWSEVASFTLTSTHEASLGVSLKTEELRLQIWNDDNPPLRIRSVRAWQLRRSLTAYLEPSHTYRVAVANGAASAPTYDLVAFRDSIPSSVPVLAMGAIKDLVGPPAEPSSPTYFTDRNIIWVAIIAVIAILGFMTMRMLREQDREETRK